MFVTLLSLLSFGCILCIQQIVYVFVSLLAACVSQCKLNLFLAVSFLSLQAFSRWLLEHQ